MKSAGQKIIEETNRRYAAEFPPALEYDVARRAWVEPDGTARLTDHDVRLRFRPRPAVAAPVQPIRLGPDRLRQAYPRDYLEAYDDLVTAERLARMRR